MRPFLALALAAGCSWFQPKPDRTRYYVIDVAAPEPKQPGAVEQPVVGLGPITLPPYLDRPELVSRVGRNELQVSTNGRWAEPLDRGFGRTLRHKIEALLGPNAVIAFPWEPAKTPPIVISVEVERFEPVGGSAELWVKYTMRESATGHIAFAGEERLSEPLADATPDAAVASLSRAVGALGRKLVRLVGDRR